MEETNTQIAWPSKLKIGAKSKKGKLCTGEIHSIDVWVYGITVGFLGTKPIFLIVLSQTTCQMAVIKDSHK